MAIDVCDDCGTITECECPNPVGPGHPEYRGMSAQEWTEEKLGPALEEKLGINKEFHERNAEAALKQMNLGKDYYDGKVCLESMKVIGWFRHFALASAMKYLWRCERKGSYLEDLRKARDYIDDLIEMEEGKDG